MMLDADQGQADFPIGHTRSHRILPEMRASVAQRWHWTRPTSERECVPPTAISTGEGLRRTAQADRSKAGRGYSRRHLREVIQLVHRRQRLHVALDLDHALAHQEQVVRRLYGQDARGLDAGRDHVGLLPPVRRRSLRSLEAHRRLTFIRAPAQLSESHQPQRPRMDEVRLRMHSFPDAHWLGRRTAISN